ncbi:MAG: hypothetical protein F4X64_14735 [Chloroflexi bacterium]|nr:hypothetical protein [Chloroflexota bacterium]
MVTISTPEDLLRVLRENPEWKEAVRREILTEELINLPARFDRFVATTEQFIEEQRRFNDRVEGFIERTDRRFSRIEDDISNMRGEHARNTAIGEAADIAENMGFQMIRVLSRDDLRELLHTSDTSGIATPELQSFRRADLVIEAADADGNIHYIAVEASNTGDERDTRRAIRNAEFLARFTGQPTHSAVASVRNDRRVQQTIDRGEIYWYELADRDAQPE